jgi:hypothetical protein
VDGRQRLHAVRSCAIIIVAAMALLVSTGRADAQVPGGTNPAGGWSYDAPNSFRFEIRIPGATVSGSGRDYSGMRTVDRVTLEDTDPDDRECASVFLGTSDSQYRESLEACAGEDNPATASAGPLFRGSFTIVGCAGVFTADPPEVTCTHLDIPDSTSDPGLRSAGTGMEWDYYAEDSFHFDLIRPGVHVVGYGSGTSPERFRSVYASVEKTQTEPRWNCAEGSVRDLRPSTAVRRRVCGSPGAYDVLARTTLSAEFT